MITSASGWSQNALFTSVQTNGELQHLLIALYLLATAAITPSPSSTSAGLKSFPSAPPESGLRIAARWPRTKRGRAGHRPLRHRRRAAPPLRTQTHSRPGRSGQRTALRQLGTDAPSSGHGAQPRARTSSVSAPPPRADTVSAAGDTVSVAGDTVSAAGDTVSAAATQWW